MDLKTYLSSIPVPERKKFAKDLGTSAAYISQLCTGWRLPSPALAKRINVLTGGKVTLHELLPDVWDK